MALPTPVLERWHELTGHTLLERYGGMATVSYIYTHIYTAMVKAMCLLGSAAARLLCLLGSAAAPLLSLLRASLAVPGSAWRLGTQHTPRVRAGHW